MSGAPLLIRAPEHLITTFGAPMSNEFLRDRIARKLASLPDERLYQLLDYVEFLESKYATEAQSSTNLFQRFAEGVEDRLRAGRVSTQTLAETMNLMHRAIGVLNGVAAAGKSVASDIADVATRATQPPPPGSSAPTPAPPPSSSSPATSRPAEEAPHTASPPSPEPPTSSSTGESR